MARVAVIGGGASGIIAAMRASEKHEVYLLEANDKVGKKILVTGNGKCNFWNKDIDSSKYNTDNKEKLDNILKNKDLVFNYLTKNLGIHYKEKNGYYYPYSSQASSIREIFEKKLLNKKINIKYNFKVINIAHNQNNFQIISDSNEKIICDKIIIATGSKAAEKTGSDGTGYLLLNNLGYNLNKVLPSLVPLKSNASFLKDWSGVRTDVNLKLYSNDTFLAEEDGEIQLTDYGISGIVTLNLSGKASKSLNDSKKVYVIIDFLPEISNIEDFFNNREHYLTNLTVEDFLESVLNYKLMYVILKKAHINKDCRWNDLTPENKNNLYNLIKKFKLEITDTDSFERSQVCTGGLSLNHINNHFQLINNKDIYVVGEILDVDGICGGYNLCFAFISGFIAGEDV